MTDSHPVPLGAVAHYTLLERLDPAGPGKLYRARDTRLGRTVTVRLLPPGHADSAARAELVASARRLESLSHPNVIAVFDAGEHESRVFLVFEHVKGSRSLRADMAGRPMPVRRAVATAVEIADAVAAAHASGFAHGGLSPDSIVMTATGHAKIPALALAAFGGFTEGPDGLRLRDYESPEEARGQPPDDRSDVYSIGAILFEMLTGRTPLHRGSAAPSRSNPRVFAELDAVVLKAIAPNPDARYGSAAALASALRGLAAMLDARDAVENEAGEGRGTTVGRVAALASAILAALAIIAWWALRP